MSGKVISRGTDCPFCGHDYSYKKRLPDVCGNCFGVLNAEPKSETFFVPDYLSFQLTELNADIEEKIKPRPSGDDLPGLDTDATKNSMKAELDNELYSFLTTSSKETVIASLGDAYEYMRALSLNQMIDNEGKLLVIEMVGKMKVLADSLKAHIEAGGRSLYEQRTCTAKASLLAEGVGDPVDIKEEEH